MDKHSSLFTDMLDALDRARNARPRPAQQPSAMVNERNARMVVQSDKVAALKRVREAAQLHQPAAGNVGKARAKRA